MGVSVFTTLALVALVEGGHVEVDILVNRLRPKMQDGIVGLMYFLTTIFLGLMSWRLILYALRIFRIHEVSAIWGISPFPFISIAAIGTILFTLVFLIHSITHILGVLKNEPR